MNRWKWIVGVGVVLCLALSDTAEAGRIVAWGNAEPWVFDVPDGDDFVSVVGGYDHALAMREDGSIVAWGADNSHGELDVPEGVFIDTDVGRNISYAIRDDGTIVAWGDPIQVHRGVPSGRFVAIETAVEGAAIAGRTRYALRDDGWIIDFGSEACLACKVFDSNDFVEISAMGGLVALREDGSVASRRAGWFFPPVPDGNDFVQVANAGWPDFGLKEDGSIVGWSMPPSPELADIPQGNDFTAVYGGKLVAVAIRTDGSLVAWGWDRDGYGQLDVPVGKGFVEVDLGGPFGLAIQVPEPSVLIGLAGAILIAGPFLLRRARR